MIKFNGREEGKENTQVTGRGSESQDWDVFSWLSPFLRSIRILTEKWGKFNQIKPPTLCNVQVLTYAWLS